jgi:hypothetical protein
MDESRQQGGQHVTRREYHPHTNHEHCPNEVRPDDTAAPPCDVHRLDEREQVVLQQHVVTLLDCHRALLDFSSFCIVCGSLAHEDIATAASWEIHVDCPRDHLYNFSSNKA